MVGASECLNLQYHFRDILLKPSVFYFEFQTNILTSLQFLESLEFLQYKVVRRQEISFLSFYLLLLELFEAYPECFLVVGRFFLVAVQEVSQEDFCHLDGSLVDGGPDAALQDHLEHDWVRRGLHYGRLQLVTLFLDVLDRSLNRGQHNLSFFLDLKKHSKYLSRALFTAT